VTPLIVKPHHKKWQYFRMERNYPNFYFSLMISGVLTNCPLFPEEFKVQSTVNYEKYAPIEINQEMSVEERIPYMMEWRNEFLKSLMKSNANQSMIKKATDGSMAYLRYISETSCQQRK